MRRESGTTQALTGLVGGIALGALAMYLSDPLEGRRRRTLAQDKMRSLSTRTGGVLSGAMRDAGSRISGIQAQATRLIGQRAKPIDDHVLEARVRSRLGRSLPHARRVDVTASQGRVTLSGPVLAEERSQLLDLVKTIPGVEDVRDRLETHDDARGSSQGSGLPPIWLMAAVGGGLLGYFGLTRRSGSGASLAAAGLGMLTETLRNLDINRLFGSGSASEPVEVEKTIEISAAPETVFDVWSNYENFPHFMAHVIEVRDLGNNRSHWVVKGPAGTDVEWDAALIESSRPHTLSWRSEPGAMVDNAGSVRLEPTARGTRATVRMSYTPPAGLLGQGVAMLLGSDPARELEDDMQRMKNFIERGMPSTDMSGVKTTAGQVLH
ncbi:MAG: hypothetical protein JWQ23_531 [Herminiimonas sp.]|nr:hypothetical protein [Herminiimonas sp.]